MGSLTPGATYIYERDEGIVYAREFGSTERKIIGMNYPYKEQTHDEVEREMKDEMLWRRIRRAAPANPALQNALDRVIMLYKLSEEKLQ